MGRRTRQRRRSSRLCFFSPGSERSVPPPKKKEMRSGVRVMIIPFFGFPFFTEMAFGERNLPRWHRRNWTGRHNIRVTGRSTMGPCVVCCPFRFPTSRSCSDPAFSPLAGWGLVAVKNRQYSPGKKVSRDQDRGVRAASEANILEGGFRQIASLAQVREGAV